MPHHACPSASMRPSSSWMGSAHQSVNDAGVSGSLLALARLFVIILGGLFSSGNAPPAAAPRACLPLPAPALCERRHRLLARGRIAVRRALDLAVVAARPHPGAILRRSRRQEDAADDDAILQDIIVIIAPQPYEREADPRLRISEAEEVLPVNRHPLTAS